MYIRNSVSAYRRSKLAPKDIESISIDVKGHNNTRFIILAYYRSPTKISQYIFYHNYVLRSNLCTKSEMNCSSLVI